MSIRKILTLERIRCAKLVCSLCAKNVPHHTNSDTSIGGNDRHPCRDLHAVEVHGGVQPMECLAYHIWELIDHSHETST